MDRELHPRPIVVSKKELIRRLSVHSNEEIILRPLAAGTAHPHFEEWLAKACYRLTLLFSFVYLVHNENEEPGFRRRTAKLPARSMRRWFLTGSVKIRRNAGNGRRICTRKTGSQQLIFPMCLSTECLKNTAQSSVTRYRCFPTQWNMPVFRSIGTSCCM